MQWFAVSSFLDVIFLFLLSDIYIEKHCRTEKLGWLAEAVGQTDESGSAVCVLRALQNHSETLPPILTRNNYSQLKAPQRENSLQGYKLGCTP